MFVREVNIDHVLMYEKKTIERAASSFVGPCLAALVLGLYGPNEFDSVMADNIFWGHAGGAAAAISAGYIGFALCPSGHIEYCFLVVAVSELMVVGFLCYVPRDNASMGRRFRGSRGGGVVVGSTPVRSSLICSNVLGGVGGVMRCVTTRYRRRGLIKIPEKKYSPKIVDMYIYVNINNRVQYQWHQPSEIF